MKTQITFKDFELTLIGYYSPEESQTYDYPGYPAIFEVNEIHIEDSQINIFDLFSNNDLEDIENLAIESIN